MAQERRSAPRTKIDCKITVISDFRILIFNTEVENIGEGGIRVFLKEKLDPKAKLDIEIFPPDKGFPIKCKGELIWMNEKAPEKGERLFDAGIRFTEISPEEKNRIKKWCSC